ncbi:Crp/Fnr family transcriptional regulator [Neptunitalea lumnitzerae]|uniref:cAMP-binding protein n=1 Tax=Neptunitalea lumnitzerae TaxID=2965509 RepID=A0ABQ5MLX1_9FLAO|nr:Crp/Fnr family transcriptional regulator [Neptunitalea sp. Y10]GLB50306.1 cAMP-binding protein [Neptunitalea sp. Y10]
MLQKHLETYSILTAEDIALCYDLAERRTLKKGDYLVQEGYVCNEIAFVEEGVLRSFYYSSSSEEVTYCFPITNNFVTAYSSFLKQTPSLENIQALTKCELLVLSRADIQTLENSSINWLKFLKLKGDEEFIAMEKRVFLLQKENAEKRYEELLNKTPELLNLVPLKYLSSYLGITERHLSRVRKGLLK